MQLGETVGKEKCFFKNSIILLHQCNINFVYQLRGNPYLWSLYTAN